MSHAAAVMATGAAIMTTGRMRHSAATPTMTAALCVDQAGRPSGSRQHGQTQSDKFYDSHTLSPERKT
jgi:hypothetical protein